MEIAGLETMPVCPFLPVFQPWYLVVFFHSPAFHRGDLNNSAKAVQLNTQLSQGSAATDLGEDVDLFELSSQFISIYISVRTLLKLI